MKDIREKALAELQAVALARPADCLRWEDGKLELKDKLPSKSAAAIASVERSSAGVKLRFHDKLKALELLLRYGAAGPGSEANNLLEALLEATKEPINTEDIPEMIGEEEQDENGIFITAGG